MPVVSKASSPRSRFRDMPIALNRMVLSTFRRRSIDTFMIRPSAAFLSSDMNSSQVPRDGISSHV